MSSRVAQLQVLLEGVPLPASKQELLHHARREGAGPGEAALIEALPEREYGSIDEVGETLQPVQPATPQQQSEQPEPESGLPPGGEAYTEPSPAPGAVRDLAD
ncbi:MAG TPA: DUF2795 domain-containing protein [Gaiellaceae bacterium]|nr:DUF2795 domain-containing protein [Gaiellaceae bacterium]